MDKGECFLMGSPGGRTKHLWVVISDTKKHGGLGVIINFTTDKNRSGGECCFVKSDHPWLTEPQSWACFGDAMLMTVQGWSDIEKGINHGFIVKAAKMNTALVNKIVEAAKTSNAFQPVLIQYLD